MKTLADYQTGHFIGGIFNHHLRLPIFTTTDRRGAEWYASERGGKVHHIAINPGKTLLLNNEQDAAYLSEILTYARISHVFTRSSENNGCGWWFECSKVMEHSPYDGTNPLDVAYIPEVRQELTRRGYSSITAFDALENTEIPVVVLIENIAQMIFIDNLPQT